MSAAAAFVFVVFGGASASAAKPLPLGGQAVSSGVSSAAAGASGGWGVGIEAALPANAATTNQRAGLTSVSCPSAGNCSAVGGYTDSSGNTDGLLMTETAGTWAPGVEAGALLDSVSCSSPGNCSAVGDTLLMTETAGRWGPGVEASLPANAGGSASLFSVSCGSDGNCSAVGWYTDDLGHTEGLLLNERDGRWATGVEAKLPAKATGTRQSSLFSVSCASAGDCTAVGGYSDSSGSGGLLLTETAGSWARGVEAEPANAATVTSVSCASAGNCSAVGSNDAQGLLLTQTDGKWAKGVAAVLPANAIATDAEQLMGLSSVSCSSPGYCSAVGTYTDDSNSVQGLLLTETAGRWANGVEALPASPESGLGPDRGLTSVSCSSPGNCSAVGTYLSSDHGPVGLLLTETGGSWAIGVEPALPANADNYSTADLNAVSCPLPGNCGVVGDYYTTEDPGGFYVGGLLMGDSSPLVQLEVSKTGAGSGTVSSLPAGIRCGSTCSASFDAGGSLTLTATPSPGSRFSGWSGAGICSVTKSCQINNLADDQTVTATFGLLPPCVVPKLQGMTLRAAKHAVRTHNCALGKTTYSESETINRGQVISQRPKAGRHLPHGARVNLVIGKDEPERPL